MSRPWGSLQVRGRGTQAVQVGPLRLHLREHQGEIQVAHERGAATSSAELSWSRWAPQRWDGRIRIHPEFPDRAVVLATEGSFRLLRGADARIYVRVPLFVRLEAGDPDGWTVLERVPTVTASDTWWGTAMEGELCYWLPTSARRKMEAGLFEEHLIACPLLLQNRSEGDLDVEKIGLRVAYLSIFTQDGRLWSDETLVRYQGEAEGSQLEMTGRAPPEEPGAVLLTPPRHASGRGVRFRTFSRLRALQPWI